MNPKMKALFDLMNACSTRAKAFMADGENKDVAKATAEMATHATLQSEYLAEKAIYDAEKALDIPADNATPVVKAVEKSKLQKFFDAFRQGLPKITKAAGDVANETTDGDGGYTVPEDISTQIEKYRENHFSLRSLVTVKPVVTQSGKRTFKKRSTHTGFAKVSEQGTIGVKAVPQFETLAYSIDKYAGYLPVTNELLEDSDANIEAELIAWLGEESVATDNANILAVLKALTKLAIATVNDLKTQINVTLGQAFKPFTKITTNDDGFNYLDQLKDANGNPVLAKDYTSKTPAMLFGYEVVTVPNSILASDIATTGKRKIPFFVGDMAEAIILWDRKQLSITASSTASVTGFNAFEQDMTLIKGMVRQDVTAKDTSAVLYDELTIDDATVV